MEAGQSMGFTTPMLKPVTKSRVDRMLQVVLYQSFSEHYVGDANVDIRLFVLALGIHIIHFNLPELDV